MILFLYIFEFQKEHLKNAQQYLHLVGGSASECDTIPGRQSMVSSNIFEKDAIA